MPAKVAKKVGDKKRRARRRRNSSEDEYERAADVSLTSSSYDSLEEQSEKIPETCPLFVAEGSEGTPVDTKSQFQIPMKNIFDQSLIAKKFTDEQGKTFAHQEAHEDVKMSVPLTYSPQTDYQKRQRI